MIEDHKWHDSRVMFADANEEYIRIIPDEYICEIHKTDVIAMAKHFGLHVSDNASEESPGYRLTLSKGY